jgi:predicted phage gp36 major capsid-like protein
MSDTTSDIPARVAVLEQIAKDTRDTIAALRDEVRTELGEVRADMRGLRDEVRTELGEVRAEMRGLRSEMDTMRGTGTTAFLWLLALVLSTFGILLGTMAHGFHWI